METLSPEHRAVLELYKKERPDIFARLPLPKKLAEEMGVPISSETVHLMDFMKSHLSIANGHYDATEERVACKVTDASGVEVTREVSVENPDDQIQNNKAARQEFFRAQTDEKVSLYLDTLKSVSNFRILSESEPALNVLEGGTNAAAVPQ